MPRVKRGVVPLTPVTRRVLDKAKGYRGARSKVFPCCQAGCHQGRPICLPRPSSTQTPVSRFVDCAHQCRCPREWHVLQCFHEWSEERRRLKSIVRCFRISQFLTSLHSRYAGRKGAAPVSKRLKSDLIYHMAAAPAVAMWCNTCRITCPKI